MNDNNGPRKPDIELKIWFDVIGIEASVLCDDKEVGGKVRDFADDHPIEALKESMVRHISEMLNKFMEGK